MIQVLLECLSQFGAKVVELKFDSLTIEGILSLGIFIDATFAGAYSLPFPTFSGDYMYIREVFFYHVEYACTATRVIAQGTLLRGAYVSARPGGQLCIN